MSCLYISNNTTKEIKNASLGTEYLFNIPRGRTTLELHCLALGGAQVHTSIAETEPKTVEEMLHLDMAEQSKMYTSETLGRARWLSISPVSGAWDIIINTGE